MSEKTREAFERWYSEYLGSTVSPARIEAAEAAWLSSRRQALEEAAAIVEALRDDHCKGTGHPLADKYACAPDGSSCDFVAAWNDAASAIRREAEGK